MKAAEVLHWAAQVGVIVSCALVAVAAWANWKNHGWERFGNWHSTPLARIWDSTAWTGRQIKAGNPLRLTNAVLHLVIVGVFPFAAVLLTNRAALDHPIAFGVAGVIAGVLAEWPEGRVRNARYANSEARVETSFAKVALCVGFFELVGGACLYYLVYKTHVLNDTLSAVVLGLAFVACAEAMSVISTLWLVARNGSPFKYVPSGAA